LKEGDPESEEKHLFLLVSITGSTEDIGANIYQSAGGVNIFNCRNGKEL
jgi:hypothetical protein